MKCALRALSSNVTLSGLSPHGLKQFTSKRALLVVTCLVLALILSRETVVTAGNQFLGISAAVGIWEACLVSVFHIGHKVYPRRYYEAFQQDDIQLHRDTLAWTFRHVVVSRKVGMGIISVKRLRQIGGRWELTEPDSRGCYGSTDEENEITLTFYVSHATLHRYPALMRTLLAPRVAANSKESFGPQNDLAPVIFSIHGGGFVYLSSYAYDKINRRFASKSDAVLVAVDYRKPPNFPFPTPLDDCLGSLQWLSNHSVALGLNMSRLAIIGDSAGGNIAIAAVANAIANPSHFSWSRSLTALGLIYPVICVEDCDTPSRHEFKDLFFSKRAAMQYFGSLYLDGDADLETNWSVHPMLIPEAILKSFPKTFLSLVSHDTLRDEGLEFFERLKSLGVNATLDITMGVHGLFGSDIAKSGDIAATRLAEALSKVLSASPSTEQ